MVTHSSSGAYAATRYPGKSWEEIEADLRRGWDEVKELVHDAWYHVTND